MNTQTVDKQKEIRKEYVVVSLTYVIGILMLSVPIPLIMIDMHKPIMGVGFWIILSVFVVGLSLVSTAASFVLRRLTDTAKTVTQMITTNDSIADIADVTVGFDPWSTQQTF